MMRIPVLAGGAILSMAVAALAFDDASQPAFEHGAIEVFATTALRTPARFFGRPARSTPQEQWAYAQTLLDNGSKRRAGKAFLALSRQWHQSSLAPEAHLAYARILEERASYRNAFREYQYLVDHYTGRFPYRLAFEAQVRIATSIMNKNKSPSEEGTASKKALPFFRRIALNAPYASEADIVRFNIALIHDENREWIEAADAYETLVMRHPTSSYTREALIRRAHCLYREAVRFPRDENGLLAAYDAHAAILHQVGDLAQDARATLSHQQQEIEALIDNRYFERAVFYDRENMPARAALIAYTSYLQRFPAGDRAETAKIRIQQLESER